MQGGHLIVGVDVLLHLLCVSVVVVQACGVLLW